MDTKWQLIEDREYWLRLVSEVNNAGAKPQHWWAATAKWDGCVDLYHAGNVPFGEEFGQAGGHRDSSACDCYIHICNLDDLIARLTTLRDVWRAKFGDGGLPTPRSTAPGTTPEAP